MTARAPDKFVVFRWIRQQRSFSAASALRGRNAGSLASLTGSIFAVFVILHLLKGHPNCRTQRSLALAGLGLQLALIVARARVPTRLAALVALRIAQSVLLRP